MAPGALVFLAFWPAGYQPTLVQPARRQLHLRQIPKALVSHLYCVRPCKFAKGTPLLQTTRPMNLEVSMQDSAERAVEGSF